MIGLCKDCKSMINTGWCGTICKRVSSYHFDVTDSELAIATCATEGIGGELVVKPDFGCVLFEQK